MKRKKIVGVKTGCMRAIGDFDAITKHCKAIRDIHIYIYGFFMNLPK